MPRRRRPTFHAEEPWSRPRSTPIRTDQGIKSRSQRGDFATNWWAERWIRALERLVDPGRLSRGRNYARQGQVLEIKEKKRQIEARVQGSRLTPYKVTIRLEPLTDNQWNDVFKTLAAQALYTAQLLNGEMPQTIEEVFAAAGVSLFPLRPGELHTKCSCPDQANPCKHVAAVHYILGEQFDEDPFLLFVLRGRSQEQVMTALRARRQPDEPRSVRGAKGARGARGAQGAQSRARGTAKAAATAAPAAAPLDANPEQFWGSELSLDHFPLFVQPPTPALPVLKRLGQPTFVARALEAMLGPAYTAVSKAALEAGGKPREDGDQES